ncbi:myosin binding protein c, slow type [Plakobranchus ocellatus]|uniref:Myosin binding protein c, slow type n=1 Tax=Plakobranchus ocellatus TaxID=259542 RepID=A0AAV4B3C6_9GAST|nr:myosin binding protein c, slow type [Plakobranchus ocellatus]
MPFASVESGCSVLAARLTSLNTNQEYMEFVSALAQDPPLTSNLWFSLLKNESTGDWSWLQESAISSDVWFSNPMPHVQEPNNNSSDGCGSVELCIVASLLYDEGSTVISEPIHKLLDTCCEDSHYFFCEDINECACSPSDPTCISVSANCQEPTGQCLDLVGGYRCLDVLPSPSLTFASKPSTFSVKSEVALNCSVPFDEIPYKDNIPGSTTWTFDWIKNDEHVAWGMEEGVLTISSLDTDTEGRYECFYHLGGVKSAKSAWLDVGIRPPTTPVLTAPYTEVSIGETANLTCSTTTPGEKLYEWTLPSGITIQTDESNYSFQMTGWQNLGLYTCRVIIQAISSTSYSSDPFVLNLKLATPSLSATKTSLTLDETANLQCISTDSPSLLWLAYEWKKDGVVIENACCGAELVFQVNDASIHGIYTCSTKYGSMESHESNKVKVKYKWSSVPLLETNTTILYPGVSVNFKCSSIEPGYKVFYILKDSQMLKMDEILCSEKKVTSDGQCWQISAIGQVSAGNYYCRASVNDSKSPLSQPVSLTLKEIDPPTIAVLSTVIVPDGPVIIICNTSDGNNDFSYVFKFETHSGDIQTVVEQAESILNISSFTTRDEGGYFCVLKQSWLESNKSNVLHLSLTTFEVAIAANALLIPKGKDVTISCSPSWNESETWKISWFMETHQINSGAKLSLTVKNFTPENEGTYRCQAYSTDLQQWISSNTTNLICVPWFHRCTCPCTNSTVNIEMSEEEIEKMTSTIKQNLTIMIGDLSAKNRRKISVMDTRLSCTSMGGAAVTIMAVIAGLIMCIDIVKL